MKYTQFCNQKYRKILKHLKLRLLSLELAIDRSLGPHASLKSYFLSEEAPTIGGKSDFGCLNQIKRLKKAFENAMTVV